MHQQHPIASHRHKGTITRAGQCTHTAGSNGLAQHAVQRVLDGVLASSQHLPSHECMHWPILHKHLVCVMAADSAFYKDVHIRGEPDWRQWCTKVLVAGLSQAALGHSLSNDDLWCVSRLAHATHSVVHLDTALALILQHLEKEAAQDLLSAAFLSAIAKDHPRLYIKVLKKLRAAASQEITVEHWAPTSRISSLTSLIMTTGGAVSTARVDHQEVKNASVSVPGWMQVRGGSNADRCLFRMGTDAG